MTPLHSSPRTAALVQQPSPPARAPGGPNSSTPRTWRMPSRSTTLGGKTREAKARRKICSNWLSRPPMPSFSKLNSLCLNSCGVEVECGAGRGTQVCQGLGISGVAAAAACRPGGKQHRKTAAGLGKLTMRTAVTRQHSTQVASQGHPPPTCVFTAAAFCPTIRMPLPCCVSNV